MLGSCTHSDENTEKVRQVVDIKPLTVVPKKFHSKPHDVVVVVPPRLIRVAYVNRPHVRWREGPGIKFQIKDEVLAQGELVVPFQSVGVWVKILREKKGKIGWVHQETLAKIEPNIRRLKIDLQSFPRVFAVHKIRRAYSYPKGDPINVAIEKGSVFSSLAISARRVLVYINSTNSVLWFDNKDAQ